MLFSMIFYGRLWYPRIRFTVSFHSMTRTVPSSSRIPAPTFQSGTRRVFLWLYI